MAVKVKIPVPLRQMTGGVAVVELQPGNVEALLTELAGKFPGIEKRFYLQPGVWNKNINIYVNNEDIRFGDNLQTQVKDGDDLSIVPAIAGG
jgi:molybdopterin converting factor small subunit